jgi:hypothetical protein
MQQLLPSKLRLLWPQLLSNLETPEKLQPYTAEEVRSRLRLSDLLEPRTAAVHAAASRTAVWSALLPERVARDLGAAGNRLATVVFWFAQGITLDEIGRRISPFGGAWDAERAVEVASALIAYVLNEKGFVDADAA